MSDVLIVRVGTGSSKPKSFRAFDEAVGRISQTEMRSITVRARSRKRAVDLGSYKILIVDGVLNFLDSLFFRLTQNRPGLLNVNPSIFQSQNLRSVHDIQVDTVDQAIDKIGELLEMSTTSEKAHLLLLLTFESDFVSSLASSFPNQYSVLLESDTPLEAEPFDFIHHVIGEVPKITCQMTFYFGNAPVYRQNYNYPTRRTGAATALSYSEDSASLLLKRHLYLQNRFPEQLEEEVHPPRIRRSSTVFSIWRLTKKFLALTVQARLYSKPRFRVFLPPKKVWSVALADTTKRASSYDFVQVPNPETSWLADPFLVEKDSDTFLFVEEFDLAKGRGEISVAEIHDKALIKPSVCLTEDFHLSFPFIFRYSDTFYMCPETHNVREIRIYKSDEFPSRWSLAARHLVGNDCSDSVIFEFKGLWWLITTKETASGGDFYSELYVYFSDNPVDGPWKEHEQNPVVVDSSRGRNGGLHICDGRIYRFGQEFGAYEYGVALHSYEIYLLSASEYREQRAQCRHLGGSIPQFSGHHMDISSKYIVIDSKK